ncbi:tumor necrosis factor ligand superfamily member 10 [Python bivittatus]|uniref:Tumor necrosis factor ligand superfamily member 10 n=1 Tax=Python bivittatus TaxID=176946 RepID=A0A9F2PM78_PYTBI|nr:tumor necrosis factor ligand superfamily member 10 [Python bivittatus]
MLASGGPSTGQTCGLVLIFAVLLQSICVAITFLYFTNELQQLRDTYAKSSIACFTRENFFLEDLDPNDKEDDDPCWEVKQQLSRLIRKMMAKNRAEEITSSTKDSISSGAIARDVPRNSAPRVAAHLTSSRNARKALVAQNSPMRNNLGFKIISWQSSADPSFLYNVLLNNGELIIQQAGLYYIYSQTYFRFRESEDAELSADPDSDSVRNPKQMVQYISKITDYYPEAILLMKSARTSCWSKKAGYGLYSIYQGGVFQLKRNDRIFVSISYEELVDMDKEASFFGAFLIS